MPLLQLSNFGNVTLYGALFIIVANQILKSTTDWTVKRGLSWVRNIVSSETTSRNQKEGNERAVDLEERLREQLKERRQEVSEYERLIRGLKNENISKKRIIDQYWKPLPALIITFYNDYAESNKDEKFLKKYILENNEAEMLTANTYAIPPKGFPDRFEQPSTVGRPEIEEWIQEDVLDDYPDGKVMICQASAVDLRRIYSHTDYDSHSFNRKTIEDALDIGDILEKNSVHRILARDNVNLSKSIENGDIAFLLSRYVSTEELEDIHENQPEIEEKLGNPSLRKIAQEDFIDPLSDAISEYVDAPEEPAQRAVEEAKLWHQGLQT